MSAVVELETLGASGFTVYGEDVEGFAGASVSNAGDVNGDGYGDFIIGAPWASRGAYLTGSAYLIYGGPNGPLDIDLGNLPDGAGFRIDGHAELDEVGLAVSGAGDVNGDGFDDVIVSALHGGFPPVLPTGFEYFSQPTAYVIYGAELGPARWM